MRDGNEGSAQSDNEILLGLQKKFLADADGDAWTEIWLRCMELAAKAIFKERAKKRFKANSDFVYDAQVTACEYVLRRLAKRDGYEIRNFPTAIYYGVIHALYHRTSAQKCESEKAAWMQVESRKKNDYEGGSEKWIFVGVKNAAQK